MTTKTPKAPRFTTQMEDRIRLAASEGELNQAVATRLAEEFGDDYSARSLIAKINRMNLPYVRKVPTSKDGSPVENKADIVAQIAQLVSGNLEGLDKAPKAALQALRNTLVA